MIWDIVDSLLTNLTSNLLVCVAWMCYSFRRRLRPSKDAATIRKKSPYGCFVKANEGEFGYCDYFSYAMEAERLKTNPFLKHRVSPAQGRLIGTSFIRVPLKKVRFKDPFRKLVHYKFLEYFHSIPALFVQKSIGSFLREY